MAIAGYPLEVCGAIYSHGIIVQHKNVHPEPTRNYDAEIDIAEAKAIWHSHPQGDTKPSENDVLFMTLCAQHGLRIKHFIVTAKEVHEYEVQSDAAASAA
jgi:proteasome lid subunit RPN8/RPN11